MKKHITPLCKPRKLWFSAPALWRKVFLCLKRPVFRSTTKFIYNRSSVVPRILQNTYVLIYTGKKWHKRWLSKWSVGFKFGELTWNRKPARYKAKQLRKKKKKT